MCRQTEKQKIKMKKIIFYLLITIIHQMTLTSNACDESIENVSLKINSNTVIELYAKKINTLDRKPADGLCIYQDQLWDNTMTDPPERIMISGHISIENRKIELDVKGLATPWITTSDLTKNECRLRKYNFGKDNNDYFYILDICFFKGGSLDYIVTWVIYKDKSLKTNIINAGDQYPDWYTQDYLQK